MKIYAQSVYCLVLYGRVTRICSPWTFGCRSKGEAQTLPHQHPCWRVRRPHNRPYQNTTYINCNLINTTGLPNFAECQLHSTKASFHSARPLLGKDTRQSLWRQRGKASDGKASDKKFHIENYMRLSFQPQIQPDITHLSETSSEILRFLSSVRYHLSEMLLIIFHTILAWNHDISTSPMIFRH